jgi:hypothetical protein
VSTEKHEKSKPPLQNLKTLTGQEIQFVVKSPITDKVGFPKRNIDQMDV